MVLLLASRRPQEARWLVWAIIGIEIGRGLIADVYMLSRGLNVTGLVIWLVIHSVVIATGVAALRRAARVADRAD